MKLIRRVFLYPLLAFTFSLILTLLYEVYVFYSSPLLANPFLVKEMASMSSSLPERVDHPSHPIVYPIHLETGETWVVKQINYTSFLMTIKSRFLLAHEYAILKSVEDLPYITKIVGRVNKDAFCMHYIPSIEKGLLKTEECIRIKNELKTTLKSLHKARLYHLDMANLDNIIISPDRSSHIIDFGRAARLNPILDFILGPFLSYRDFGRFFRSMYDFNPDALDLKELDQLIFYRKITNFFSSNKKDNFLDKVITYRQERIFTSL